MKLKSKTKMKVMPKEGGIESQFRNLVLRNCMERSDTIAPQYRFVESGFLKYVANNQLNIEGRECFIFKPREPTVMFDYPWTLIDYDFIDRTFWTMAKNGTCYVIPISKPSQEIDSKCREEMESINLYECMKMGDLPQKRRMDYRIYMVYHNLRE